MKSKQLFLCIVSLLLTSLIPGKAYADDSSQIMGSNNKNSPQINGDGNTVCNNCNIYTSETPQTTIQTTPSPITFGSQISAQSRNQPSSNWCKDPDLSNEDKHAIDCPGY